MQLSQPRSSGIDPTNSHALLRHVNGITLSNGLPAPDTIALLVAGRAGNPLPLFGGIVHPDLGSAILLTFATDASGRFAQTVNLPVIPTGAPLYLQSVALDLTASFAVSLGNAIVGTIQ